MECEISAEDLPRIMSFAEQILRSSRRSDSGRRRDAGVSSERHGLTLFTKGNPEEQKLKLDRSGLGIYFGHVAIVKEKDAQSYARADSRAVARSGVYLDDRESA